jgi:peptidoglycan/xylan/chitin deacetylase (PgdA/CDA1 family)
LSLAFWIHPPAGDLPAVTVLCYHTFDAKKITPFTVDLARFEAQMRYLKVQKIPVIPLARLVEHLQTGVSLPEQAVVITIDDGYKTAYTKAWPVLKRYKFPFTLFVYPRYIDTPAGLSWAELREMSRAGVDIQSHSVTHPLLTHPPNHLTGAPYEAWLDQELVESKRIIEHELGKPVNALAYPFGGYDERIVEHVRKAGYAVALTCDDGNVTRRTDPLHVNRRLVYHHVRPKEFAAYFPERSLQMSDLTPRDGERVHSPITEIRARVVNVDQVLPGSGSIIVDKVSKQYYPVKIDPKTGEVRFPLPAERKKGYYFVSLFARDKANPARLREASWLFIVSKNVSKN